MEAHVILMYVGSCDIIMMPNQTKGLVGRSARTNIREIRKAHTETKKAHAETLMFLKTCDIIMMPN
jgi:hypothetical protein